MIRKTILKKIFALTSAALMLCGCTNISEELPESFFLTEVTDESSCSETASASETTAEPAVTEITTVTETEPVTESETAAPTETEVTETTPETTAAETAAQQITVLTIPSQTTARTTETSEETEPTAATEITTEAYSETVPVTVSETALENSGGYYPVNNYYALNFDIQKGVWISFLEYDRIMKNASEEQFRSELEKCFDNIASLGCNTVYFQVRAYGDAYYSSSLFPKGDRLTGDYDPLGIAVKAAHDRGLSIHAWINPMRLMTPAQMENVSDKYAVGSWYRNAEGTYVVSSGGRYYLNPAYSETVSLICDGIKEIVSFYDVDGIQIDDYFYPEKSASFDKAAYTASGTSLGLADWRRQNINSMVKRMYEAVHGANPTAVFGISPQGNLSNNYNDLYADVYKWCAESGYCDYICPQIYFGFDNSTLPYGETTAVWAGLVTAPDVDLVIGLAAYKSGLQDNYAGDGKYEWINSADILSRQRDYALACGGGYAFFRYDSLFEPDSAAAANINKEIENLKK